MGRLCYEIGPKPLRQDNKDPQVVETESELPAQSDPDSAPPPENDLTSADQLLSRPTIERGTEPSLPGPNSMATAVPTGGVVPVGDGQAVFPAEQSDEEPAGFKSLLRETLETVILAVLIFLVIRTLVQNYRIEGQSMEPNFQHGQYLLVNKLAYRLGDYSRGDVIVFHYPNNPSQDYIKRVIGLPGDTIEFRDGVLMVNGLNVAEPYDQVPIARDIQAQTVAPGFLYVLGDNRPASSDTRTWGQLSQEFVIGKAWFAIWPVTDAGPVAHPPIELGPALEQSP